MLEEMADGQMLAGLLISSSRCPSPPGCPGPSPLVLSLDLSLGDTKEAKLHWVCRGERREGNPDK